MKWTGLGNNFGKELKKLVSLDWETMLHSRWLWVHFKVLHVLRDVMEPRKTSVNVVFILACDE